MKMMIKESRVCGAKHAFLALNYEKSIWVQNMQIFSGGFCKAFESPFSSSSAEKWLKSLWICETYGYDERRVFFAKLFMHLFYVFSYFAYFHRSVTLHTGFSILVCANQFFGDPIQCDLVSENTTYFRSNSVIRKANFK